MARWQRAAAAGRSGRGAAGSGTIGEAHGAASEGAERVERQGRAHCFCEDRRRGAAAFGSAPRFLMRGLGAGRARRGPCTPTRCADRGRRAALRVLERKT